MSWASAIPEFINAMASRSILFFCSLAAVGLLAVSCADATDPDARPTDTATTAANPQAATSQTLSQPDTASSIATTIPPTAIPIATIEPSPPRTPTPIDNSPALSISAGDKHACALREGGTISCWGDNESGQLGSGETESSDFTEGSTGSPTPVQVQGIADARSITAGGAHSCSLHETGRISCWGRNGQGELGNGLSSNTADQVPGITDAIAIATGSDHTCALHENGQVSCWGRNLSGQLGKGSISQSPEILQPGRVEGIADATAITAGQAHTCALHQSGAISCWGWNSLGQLGDGQSGDIWDANTSADSTTPVRVREIADAVDVKAGNNHTCALHAGGAMSCWGNNWAGTLGSGQNHDELDNSAVPVSVIGINDATAISTGAHHTCAVHEEGAISCWGNNFDGQLGNRNSLSDADSSTPVNALGIDDAIAIAAGERHTCALREAGTISCWGDNEYGQLGVGSGRTYALAPVKAKSITGAKAITAGSFHNCAVLGNNTVSCWGNNLQNQLGTGQLAAFAREPWQTLDVAGAIDVAAGGRHTCALHEDGAVSCWGHDNFEQLGRSLLITEPSTGSSPLPVWVTGITDAVAVAAGGSHTCALLFTGNVFCWGANSSRQLGNGQSGTEKVSLSPTPVSDIRDAVIIAAGASHTCVIHRDGSVSCWGANEYGQLGNGTSVPSAVPVKVEGIIDAAAITAGGQHTCALHEDSSVSCWGNNESGQLGNGMSDVELISSGVPTKVLNISDAIAVSAGGNHTCAAHQDNTVSCWGSVEGGQLGYISQSITDDNFRAVPQKLRVVSDAIDIAAGGMDARVYEGGYTCALHLDGTISCWGNNEEGQLGHDNSYRTSTMPVSVEGIGDATAVAAGFLHSCAVHEGGRISCWGDNESGQLGNGTAFGSALPLPVEGIADAIAVATSGHWSSGYSCALHQSGNVSCWGANEEGQLGNGTKSQSTVPVRVEGITDAVAIAIGWDHSCVIHQNGSVSCWGGNEDGQLGNGTETGWSVPVQVEGVTNATSITAGINHTCALHEDGTISCWGNNEAGQLGNSTLLTSSVPARVEKITDATAIAAGFLHTCALLEDASVSCWGHNFNGELGMPSDGQISMTPLEIEGIRNAADIATGFEHTCTLRQSGAITCWGGNQEEQLGGNDFDYTSGFPLAQIEGITDAIGISTNGGAHTCAILQDNTIKCWGFNGGGQLGHGFAPWLPQKVTGFGG